MSDIKKLVGQTAIYGIPTIIGRFLNYFLVPLYTYTMATSSYGVISELYAYISFLMVILTYGMETAFFRFSQTEERKDIVFNTSLLSLIISTSLFLVFSFIFLSPISNVLDYSNNQNYIALFLLILALDALRAIPYSLLRIQQKAKRFAFIKSMDIFSNIFFNLFFFLACPMIMNSEMSYLVSWFFNPDDLVLYIFVSNLLASTIALLLLLPEYLQFKFDFNFKLLRKMLAYGLPVMIGGLAGMVNETFDRIALKHIITIPEGITDAAAISKYKMSQLGIYGACYKISIILVLFIQAFKFAAEPFFFSKMKQDDAKQTYSSVMLVFVLFLCFIFLSVIAYLDIFKYFVGASYRQGLVVVPILLISKIFLGIYYNLAIWYKVTDKTKYGAYIAFYGAGATILFNILFVPRFGYVGAAWTTLISYFTIMVICYLYGQKYYPIDYKIKRLATYFFVSIGLYLLMYFLPIENIYLKLTLNTILLLSFLVLAYKLDIKRLIRR